MCEMFCFVCLKLCGRELDRQIPLEIPAHRQPRLNNDEIAKAGRENEDSVVQLNRKDSKSWDVARRWIQLSFGKDLIRFDCNRIANLLFNPGRLAVDPVLPSSRRSSNCISCGPAGHTWRCCSGSRVPARRRRTCALRRSPETGTRRGSRQARASHLQRAR